MINLLRRDPEGDAARGYRALIELIDASHESQRSKSRMRREAAVIFRSLRKADIVEIMRDPQTQRPRVGVHVDLQDEFALDRALSLYLVETLAVLDPDESDYADDAISVIEAIQEDPRRILYRQEARLKGELIEQLKAEGVPYEERIRLLDEVSWPRPNAEFLYATFDVFAENHPWVRGETIRPKGIVSEMFETYSSFEDYVRLYGIARSEGLLLRYIGDVYRTLVKTVPEQAMNERLHELRAYLRTLLVDIDSSLIDEWESRLEGAPQRDKDKDKPAAAAAEPDLATDAVALRARARAELHALVRALSERRYDDAARLVHQDPTDYWGGERLEQALAPYYESHAGIRFDHEARLAEHQQIRALGPQRFEVLQVLLDPEGEHDWHVAGEIDLTRDRAPHGPLVRLVRIGS